VENLRTVTAPSGKVGIVMPDILSDIFAAIQSERDVDELMRHKIRLQKIDKFTGRTYPFYINRVETILYEFYRVGFILERLEQYEKGDYDMSHYFYMLLASTG
jgi:hypothetical protein